MMESERSTLSPGNIVRLRERRASGVAPNVMLRELLLDNPYEERWLALGLVDAFGTSLGAVGCVQGWQHDGAGELDDAALDAQLTPVLGVACDPRHWPVGAVVGDGALRVETRVVQSCGQCVCEGADDEGLLRFTFWMPGRELHESPRRLLRGVDGVPPIVWLGSYAGPQGEPGKLLVERVKGRSAREALRGPQPKSRIAPILKRLLAISAGLRGEQDSLQCVRPETIDIAEDQCLGASPRTERIFLAGHFLGWSFHLEYLAPESIDRRTHSEAADVFTLAVLANEWLTGTHPFAAPNIMAHEIRIRRAEASGVEDAFLRHALALDPRLRPSAREFEQWLTQP